MWKFTWAQMRRHRSRLVATGVAIALSTGFVAAAVIGMTAVSDTVKNAFSAELAQADVGVQVFRAGNNWSDSVPVGAEAAIRSLPGVATTYEPHYQFTVLIVGDHRERVIVMSAPESADFLPRLVAGRAPAGSSEVVVGAQMAERFGLAEGATVNLSWPLALASDATPAQVEDWNAAMDADEPPTRARTATVVGLFDDKRLDLTGAIPGMIGFQQDRDAATGLLGFPEADMLLVRVAPGTDPAAVAAAVNASGAGLADGQAYRADTKQDLVDRRAASYLGDVGLVSAAVGLFIGVALVVAGLVISNTLQVMVAQRTRTLSLLRCVGATKTQVRRSVLQEAALLGGFGGLAGLLLGGLLIQGALLVIARFYPDMPVPTLITVTPTAVVLPLLAGLVVTLAAALVPARLATRVRPVAALRPQAPPTLKARAGKVRLTLSVLAMAGGVALLVWASARMAAGGTEMPSSDFLLNIAAGSLGGAIFFVAAIVSAVFWVPRVVSWAAALIRRLGPAARIAGANTLRNPRRTAATATALIVGVTLVVAVSAGASTVQQTLTKIIDGETPLDVTITVPQTLDADAAVPAGLVEAVAADPGVETVLTPAISYAAIAPGACATAAECGADNKDWPRVTGVEPDRVAQLFHGDALTRPLASGAAVMTGWTAQKWGLTDGGQATLTGPKGSVTLPVRVSTDSWVDGVLMPLADYAALTDVRGGYELWASLRADANAVTVFDRLERIASDHTDADGNPPYVSGLAKKRAAFNQVITTLLIIVTALFSVAVVIAFVGVANTLSLSVIERRRESALLRALGLTRGQMRGMLAVEGVIIAGVGAVLGIVLGLALGWAASYLLLSQTGGAALTASPWQVGTTLAVAVVAGLVASVLPGRAAARAQPALALASE